MTSDQTPTQSPKQEAEGAKEPKEVVIGRLLHVNQPRRERAVGARWKPIEEQRHREVKFRIATEPLGKDPGHTFLRACPRCDARPGASGSSKSLPPRQFQPFHCRYVKPPYSACVNNPKQWTTHAPGDMSATTYVKHYNRLNYARSEYRAIRIDARVQRVEPDGAVHEYSLAGVHTIDAGWDAQAFDPDPWNYGEPTDALLGLYLNLNDEDNAANAKFLPAVAPMLVDELDVTIFDDGSSTMTAYGYDGFPVGTGTWPDLP